MLQTYQRTLPLVTGSMTWRWSSSVTTWRLSWSCRQWRRFVWSPVRMTPWRRKRTSHCSLSKSLKWVSGFWNILFFYHEINKVFFFLQKGNCKAIHFFSWTSLRFFFLERKFPNVIWWFNFLPTVHMCTYQTQLINRYSRLSSILEMDLCLAQQVQREV